MGLGSSSRFQRYTTVCWSLSQHSTAVISDVVAHGFTRTVRPTFYGGALLRPLLATGFSYLDRLTFKTAAHAAFWRMAQFMIMPGVVAFCFGSRTLLEGKGVSEAKGRIEKAYVL